MPRISARILRVGEDPIPNGALVLVPANARAVEELDSFAKDKGRQSTTVLPYGKADALRDWYWGLVQEVADGLGILKDDLHVQLKVDTKFFKGWALGRSGPIPILRSISRDISVVDLRRYVEAAEGEIWTHWVPKIGRADILARVEAKYGARPV